MANITLMGASYTDVPAVDLPQTGGGTVRFYENGGGGGTSAQTATGTVSGSGAIRLSIPCDFEPDLICVHGDLTGSASLRGVVSVIIIKDTLATITSDGSQNNTDEFLYNMKYGITGLNESDSSAIHASYSDGYITIDAVDNTSACRFNSSVTYAYKFVKWT